MMKKRRISRTVSAESFGACLWLDRIGCES
ncbi:hypothetical protein ACHAWF_003349 [Thalassiosira exigua]